MGVDGQPKLPVVYIFPCCRMESIIISHSFLYMPECPVSLLGRDLLNKLRASIFLGQGEVQRGKESEQRRHLFTLLTRGLPLLQSNQFHLHLLPLQQKRLHKLFGKKENAYEKRF